MSPALVQLIIALAPYGVQIVLALLTTLENLINGGHDVPTAIAVSNAIVTGIDIAHPDWTEEARAQCAKEAIAVYATRLKEGRTNA